MPADRLSSARKLSPTPADSMPRCCAKVPASDKNFWMPCCSTLTYSARAPLGLHMYAIMISSELHHDSSGAPQGPHLGSTTMSVPGLQWDFAQNTMVVFLDERISVTLPPVTVSQ